MQKEKWRIMAFGAAMVVFSSVFPVISFGQSARDCADECYRERMMCDNACYEKYELCVEQLQAQILTLLNNPNLTPEKRRDLELELAGVQYKCFKKQMKWEKDCRNKYGYCIGVCYGYGDPDGHFDPRDPCIRSNNPSGWCPPECSSCP